MEQIVIKAFAKINLCLDIVGINTYGYHELDTVMQSVDLYDTITVKLNNSGRVKVNCSDSNICGSDNIVLHAAKLFFDEIGSALGADIFVDKNIPLRSGLGGGSADAAAVLNALNSLFLNPAPFDRLLQLGLSLGADVPFCMVGGTKRCKGIGEVMSDIGALDFGCFVLVNCGGKESTKKMYATIDSATDLVRPNVDNLILGICNKSYDAVKENTVNVFSCCYDLNKVKSDALSCGADSFCLSGSGSYGFCLLKDKLNARLCCEKLIKLGYTAYVCEPKAKGYEIISE